MKNNIIISMLIIILICTVSCAQQPIKGVESSISKEGDIERIKVTTDKANIRSGCSENTPVLETSNKNNTFDVISKVANWYAIKLPNNNIGFIPQKQCKPIVVDDKEPTTPDVTPNTTPETTGNTPTTPDANTNANTLTNQEQQMVNLVNKARAQNNVRSLKVDMELTNVARIKSQDMIDNNYFSHYSPTYGSPFDMMNDFGIEYVRAGENIAGNQSVENAHNALMNSPGHRKNILDPNFTHIGIGIKRGGPYRNMFTQMFISKPK